MVVFVGEFIDLCCVDNATVHTLLYQSVHQLIHLWYVSRADLLILQNAYTWHMFT